MHKIHYCATQTFFFILCGFHYLPIYLVYLLAYVGYILIDLFAYQSYFPIYLVTNLLTHIDGLPTYLFVYLMYLPT
jgi:hypothetical protein